MFNSIFRKLFWKEFRTLWPLWMAVVALWGFIGLGIFGAYDEPNQVNTRNYWIFLVAAMLPALYGLGSAGTQFAWELEAGTFKRLRAWPVSSGQVVWGKLAWTIVSTIALAATLWGASYFFTGEKAIPDKTAFTFLNVYGFAAFEAIAWGAIVSLRSRSPLIATIIAGVVGILVFSLEISVFVSLERINVSSSKGAWSVYTAAWPLRLVVLMLMTGIIVYLGRSWFFYWRRKESQGLEHDSLFNTESHIPKTYITGDGGFMALCQQCWPRNLKLWFITGMAAVTIVFAGSLYIATPPRFNNISIGDILALAAWGVVISCIGIASNVFGADQSDKGFRFFAHHGVKTRTVWFSRILISGLLFFTPWCIGLAILLIRLSASAPPEDSSIVLMIGLTSLAFGLCLFMIGAFFSILCKSRVLAWVWTFGLSIVCVLLFLILFRYQVSMFLMLLPTLGFMLCSYLCLDDKIHDRTGLRVWLKKLSPLVVCMVVFVGLVIYQRVESVPNVEIDPAWIADYEQAWKSPESARLMQELLSRDGFEEKSVKVNRPPEWLEPGEQTLTDGRLVDIPTKFEGKMTILGDSYLNKLLRIANSPKEPDWSTLLDWTTSDAKREMVQQLTNLRHCLFHTAEYYSRMGKPEKSLDCLLAAIRLSPPWEKTGTATIVFDLIPQWAIGPDVTPELIQQAIKRIEALPHPSIDLQRTLVTKLLQNQETLDDLELVGKRMGTDHRMFFTLLPWELARTKRISKLSAIRNIKWISLWEQESRFGFFYNEIPKHQEEIDNMDLLLDKIRVGVLGDISGDYQTLFLFPGHFTDHADFRKMELFKRLALTSLAIRTYQLEHDGALPEMLYAATKKLIDNINTTMPGGPAFGFRVKGLKEKIYLQPGISLNGYKRPSLIKDHSIADKPCIVLDTEKAFGLQYPKNFSEEDDNILLNLPEQQFNTLPTVYPLPFGEKKHEEKEEE